MAGIWVEFCVKQEISATETFDTIKQTFEYEPNESIQNIWTVHTIFRILWNYRRRTVTIFWNEETVSKVREEIRSDRRIEDIKGNL